MSAPLAIVGHAMLTALGNTGATTCAALRAGIGGAREAPLWDRFAGTNVRVARPRLRQWWSGPTMIPELLAPVIAQCTAQARQLGLPAPELPVLVLLSPRDRPHRAPGFDDLVLSALARHRGDALPPRSGVIAGGRTGIAQALTVAAGLIGRGAPACLIVGAESFLTQPLIEHYLDRGRLFSPANSNGFLPGEAACGVIVTPSGDTRRDELVIAGIGQAVDASRDGGHADAPVRGDGLTQAIRSALTGTGIDFHDLHFSISDHNGERFKFKEQALAGARLDHAPDGGSRRPRGFMDVWHPAEGIGEVGAATFPCLLGWALEAGVKAYAPGQHALLHAGEDDGSRIALITRFERGDATGS
ncbi:hypothetical protein ACQ859_19440 [Roseateles chitinivorans]|uniref:hypothetical protein n=1 Tax=Roseateles chitinivorans TaxID=2917965 RepID=UPI003D668201